MKILLTTFPKRPSVETNTEATSVVVHCFTNVERIYEIPYGGWGGTKLVIEHYTKTRVEYIHSDILKLEILP